MIFKLQKLVTTLGAGKEAYCTILGEGKEAYCNKTGAGKEAYFTKTGAGKGYLLLLIKSKKSDRLASKASWSRVSGEGSQSSLARELEWRQYRFWVFGEGIVILPTLVNLCDHHWTFFLQNNLEQEDQQESLPDPDHQVEILLTVQMLKKRTNRTIISK